MSIFWIMRLSTSTGWCECFGSSFICGANLKPTCRPNWHHNCSMMCKLEICSAHTLRMDFSVAKETSNVQKLKFYSSTFSYTFNLEVNAVLRMFKHDRKWPVVLQGERTRRSSAGRGGAVSLPAPLSCQRNGLPPLHLCPLQAGGTHRLPGGCQAVAMVSKTSADRQEADALVFVLSMCL